MIEILFEFIKIEKKEKFFDLNQFLQNFQTIEYYKNYSIEIEKIEIISEIKNYSLFNFIIIKQENIEERYIFLTFYSKDYNLFFINIDNNNKEKLILLNFLNKKFSHFYYFKPYIPSRGHIWDFLKQVDIIELEIIVNNEIINYSEIDDRFLLKKLNQDIERYPIQTTHISFKVDHNTIALILYGNKFELPGYTDIKELNLIIQKLSPIFS